MKTKLICLKRFLCKVNRFYGKIKSAELKNNFFGHIDFSKKVFQVLSVIFELSGRFDFEMTKYSHKYLIDANIGKINHFYDRKTLKNNDEIGKSLKNLRDCRFEGFINLAFIFADQLEINCCLKRWKLKNDKVLINAEITKIFDFIVNQQEAFELAELLIKEIDNNTLLNFPKEYFLKAIFRFFIEYPEKFKDSSAKIKLFLFKTVKNTVLSNISSKNTSLGFELNFDLIFSIIQLFIFILKQNSNIFEPTEIDLFFKILLVSIEQMSSLEIKKQSIFIENQIFLFKKRNIEFFDLIFEFLNSILMQKTLHSSWIPLILQILDKIKQLNFTKTIENAVLLIKHPSVQESSDNNSISVFRFLIKLIANRSLNINFDSVLLEIDIFMKKNSQKLKNNETFLQQQNLIFSEFFESTMKFFIELAFNPTITLIFFLFVDFIGENLSSENCLKVLKLVKSFNEHFIKSLAIFFEKVPQNFKMLFKCMSPYVLFLLNANKITILPSLFAVLTSSHFYANDQTLLNSFLVLVRDISDVETLNSIISASLKLTSVEYLEKTNAIEPEFDKIIQDELQSIKKLQKYKTPENNVSMDVKKVVVPKLGSLKGLKKKDQTEPIN